MTWQPSRIVPGLAQYLAAKGMAPAPIPTETPRREVASAAPLAIQLDTTGPPMHAVPQCPRPLPQPTPKRAKVDVPVQVQPHRLKPSNSVPDDLRLDPVAVPSCAPATSKSIDDLPPVLRSSLLPFQEEGVRFAIERGGRVMIGDDMGLGSIDPLFIISLHASSLVHHCVFPPPPAPRDTSSHLPVLAAARQLARAHRHACQHARSMGRGVGALVARAAPGHD
jgi:hypothetical protein